MISDHLNREIERGEILFRKGHVQGAIHAFDGILSRMPDCIPALNNKGVALNGIGNYQEAERTFWKVLHLEKNNSDAVFNLLLLNIHNGNWNQVDDILRVYGHNLKKEDMATVMEIVETEAGEMNEKNPSAYSEADHLSEQQDILSTRTLFSSSGVPNPVPPGFKTSSTATRISCVPVKQTSTKFSGDFNSSKGHTMPISQKSTGNISDRMLNFPSLKPPIWNGFFNPPSHSSSANY